MDKFKKSHKIVACVALACAIIAYVLQLAYCVSFFSFTHGEIASPNDVRYYNGLMVSLIIMMTVCIAIIGYSAFSIYRLIYDDDSIKQGADVMFIFPFVGFMYFVSGMQSLSYTWIYNYPVDSYTITTIILAALTMGVYIPLLFVSNDPKLKFLRYGLRFLVMALSTANVILNIVIFSGGDAFSVGVSVMELLVPLSTSLLLLSES